ncbi:MAG: TolC family protein [Saprospiraceae bacterium]
MLINSVYLKYISNKCRIVTFISLALLPMWAYCQDFDPLVRQAWANNQELKAKHFQLESATQALLEAKAMYGPEVKFGVQYTLAAGGRSIALLVGDLLNPVYSTLNQLTQSNAFPQIQNVKEQFLPNNFYDARFRVSQPIYYPDLAINKRLKTELIEQKNLEIKAFKRMISKQVMQAYIQYAATQHVINIYQSADTLLAEAKRSTHSMIKNGVALPTALSRLENQNAELISQKTEATANHANAAHYLRFLLGLNDNDELPVVEEVYQMPPNALASGSEREELLQLNQAIKLQTLSIEKENNFYLPKLAAQLDAGSQDYNFGWQPYAILGVNLEMNIFDSKKHSYRKQSAKTEIAAIQATYEQADQQIELQRQIAKENLDAAIVQANVYESRIKATKKIYDEVFTKYKIGNASYIELIDAQNQFTSIQLHHLLAKNNAWIKWSEYVYALALFPIQ